MRLVGCFSHMAVVRFLGSSSDHGEQPLLGAFLRGAVLGFLLLLRMFSGSTLDIQYTAVEW